MNLNNEIVFKLNEQEKIVIRLEESIDNVSYDYKEYMILYLKDKKPFNFSLDTIHYYLEMLRASLKQALENKIPLDESIVKDLDHSNYSFIGGYWGDEKTWFRSWIYNDLAGNIIFEITPSYKWYFREPEEGEDYITHEEWIKSYKSCLIRKIPKSVAKEWVKQADDILKKIEKNVARWKSDE